MLEEGEGPRSRRSGVNMIKTHCTHYEILKELKNYTEKEMLFI